MSDQQTKHFVFVFISSLCISNYALFNWHFHYVLFSADQQKKNNLPKLTSGTDCTGPRPDGPATGSTEAGRPTDVLAVNAVEPLLLLCAVTAALCFGLIAEVAAPAAAAAAASSRAADVLAGEPRDVGRPTDDGAWWCCT